MSFDISIYVDPGVYQQEVIQPQSLNLGTLPSLLAVVGIAPRVAIVSSEAVRRGQVFGEVVSFANVSPHTYTTVNNSTRRQSDTQLFKTTNGQNLLMPNNSYVWLPAQILGTGVAPFNITAGSFITLELDGKGFISIPLTTGATRSATQIATDINTALGASPLYGVSYNAVASVVGGFVQIVSPNSALPQNSDLRFIVTPQDTSGFTGLDDTTLIFGVANPFAATSTLQLQNSFWTGTDTFSINYIATNTLLDPLQNTNVQSIQKVGLYSGVTSFQPVIDYNLTSNDVDWTPNTEATLTGPNGTFNTTVNNTLFMALNGLPVLSISLPSGAAETATQIKTAINQA